MQSPDLINSLGSPMQSAPADPLTNILGSAATSLTCTIPDSEAPQKAPELNPGHILAGTPTTNRLQVQSGTLSEYSCESVKENHSQIGLTGVVATEGVVQMQVRRRVRVVTR